jgi:glyoxylase-like metal-dependent hydrolase (beta-lactamase superfamily II)
MGTTLAIGDIMIHSLTELQTTGGTRFILPQATPEAIKALPWLTPHFADANGRLTMAVQSFLVETAGRRIVVDTGLGNHKSDRIVPGWNGRIDDFLDRMTAAGFGPDDVDMVVNTHLHVDHVGWNTRLVDGAWVPIFPKARYVTTRTEFDYWRDQTDDAEHRAVFADSVKPVADAGLYDLIEAGGEIAPGITTIATPGHSIGHMSLHLQSRGDTAILGGDIVHHACQFAHPEWSATPDYDKAQSAATRRDFFERFAGSDVVFIAAHAPDGRGGTIVRDGEGFRLRL